MVTEIARQVRQLRPIHGRVFFRKLFEISIYIDGIIDHLFKRVQLTDVASAQGAVAGGLSLQFVFIE